VELSWNIDDDSVSLSDAGLAIGLEVVIIGIAFEEWKGKKG
jgi:hypothetical protein